MEPQTKHPLRVGQPVAEDPQPEAEVEPEAVSTKTTKADVKEMQASLPCWRSADWD